MRRRDFIAGLGGAAVVGPRGAFGQNRRRPMVAWLGGSSQAVGARNHAAFLRGLQELGHENGRTIDIVYRWADGDLSRQSALAQELIALNPDVIVTANPQANGVVRQATQIIPVVGALISDPLGTGLAESHNRPGRNVTGVLITLDSLPGKRLDLLIQLVPRAAIVGVLGNPASPTHFATLAQVEAAAKPFSVTLAPVEARTPTDLPPAFEALKRNRADALFMIEDIMLFTEATRIVALAAAAQMPTIYGFRQHVEQGGLMSYGVDIPQNFRRAAYFVVRILEGRPAGELPIELPTKLELAINLKAAKSLGIDVPSKLLFTADEVIE